MRAARQLLSALLFGSAIAIALPCVADVRFSRLTPEDGLPGLTAFRIAQDVRGFLWIGDAQDGLIRYDGHEFRAYRNDPGDSRSLSSNEVVALHATSNGDLWVGTNNGLNRLDASSDKFDRITTTTSSPAGLTHDTATSVLLDSAGRLWVGTYAGLNRLDPGATKFRNYHNSKSAIAENPNADTFMASFEDSAGRIWFGTSTGGLLRYDAEQDKLQHFVYQDHKDSPPIRSVASILEDNAGRLWLAGHFTLASLDPDTMQFESYYFAKSPTVLNRLGFPEDAARFSSIALDKDDNLWVTTHTAGAYRIAPDRMTLEEFRHDPSDSSTLANDQILGSYVDRSGQVWLAGHGGLNRYDPLADAVDFVDIPAELAETLVIGGLGTLSDGQLVVHERPYTFWRVDVDSGKWKRIARFAAGELSEVNGFWVTADDSIWISNIRAGREVIKLNPSNGTTQIVSLPSYPDIAYVGPSGTLWFGMGARGLLRRDPATGKQTRWTHDPDDPTSLGHDYVWDILEDPSGDVWLGTYRGLDRLDVATGRFTHYDPDPKDATALPSNVVSRLLKDEDGNIWLHSTAGIARYDRTRDRFERFQYSGSPIDVVARTTHLPVSRDSIWWGGATGLLGFDVKDRRYVKYGSQEGVFRDPLDVATLPDGHVAMSFGDRIGVLSRSRVRPNALHPQVSLTDISLGGKPLVVNSEPRVGEIAAKPWGASSLILPHNHSPLTFRFAALDFANPQRNGYAYRLEGLDVDWTGTDAGNRLATYTTLPPGNYRFRVRAANASGVWNDDGLSFSLTVLPPWWKTWWAYAAYAIAASLLLTISVGARTRSLRTRATRLQVEVANRTQELLDQKSIVESQARNLEQLMETKDRLTMQISHEFRTPLTVILGPLDRFLTSAQDDDLRGHLDATKRNASRLLRLVNQMLGLARLRSGHFEGARPVRAAPVIRQVVASFESLAKERGLDLAVEPMEDVTLLSTEDALEKITVNLVSNAIKYSQTGARIRVSIANSGDTGTISVFDTGRGIDPQRLPHIFEPFERGHDEAERIPGSGLGLALVHGLATAHGGKVEVESKPGVGSTFRVTLPSTSTGTSAPFHASRPSEDVRLEVDALRASRGTAADVQTDAESRLSVLVVEDNADMREYLGQVLGSVYALSFAEDGEVGLEKAFARVPDLIVCDVMLPRKDGYEVCHALKTDERTSHIPVIMLTALEGHDERMKGLAERADDYLTKPFDEDELKQRIANLLGLRAMLQRRYSRDLRFDKSVPADLSSRDQKFLEKLSRYVAVHHADPELGLPAMASMLAVSERNLQRKLKALVGLSPGEYLRGYRLQRAMERLLAGERPGDVAAAVGFASQAYFSTCFRTQYGFSPSEARERASRH